MKTRKILCVLLAAAMVLAFTACSSSSSSTDTTAADTAAETVTEAAEDATDEAADETAAEEAEDTSEAAEAAAEGEDVEAAAYVDGTYTSAGFQGMKSEIVATVTIEGGVITAIDADFSGETENLGGVAGPKMIDAILEAQSTEVDTVSGATITSQALIDAVNDALAQAQ